VLDVGAAGGAFLDEVRKRGADVFAIEPNPSHAPLLTDKAIAHKIGYLDDDIAGPFDVVTCFEVIERIFIPSWPGLGPAMTA